MSEICNNPVYTNAGVLLDVLYAATDISSRMAKRIKIKQQNAALREIARIQSHEIRRPLAAILGLVNIIRDLPGDELPEYIRMLDAAATELDQKVHTTMKMINDVYDGLPAD